MKKIILFLVVLVVSSSIHSQECGTDAYNEQLKKLYPEKYKKSLEEFKSFKNKSTELSMPTTPIRIPVVFHVIHHGESIGTGSNISETKINEQLAILNASFGDPLSTHEAGFGTPTNAKFEFCRVQTSPFGSPTNGITRKYGPDYYLLDSEFSEDLNIKSNYWNPNIYLNIWITDIRPASDVTNVTFGGYSNFPHHFSSRRDGIVLNYRFVGGNMYDNGTTLTHEVGHWLGLYHIFLPGSCRLENTDGYPCDGEYGDGICDTPPLDESARNVNINNVSFLRNSCENGNYVLPRYVSPRNFMDYYSNSTFFTELQVKKMHEVSSFYRPLLYDNPNLNASCGFNTGGGTSNGCNNNSNDNIPVQTIYAPHQLDINVNDNLFGGRIEVNNKWLVAIDAKENLLLIYDREGCAYNLKQNFSIDFYWGITANEGLVLNDNEIIVSSWKNDIVYVYNYNVVNDQWYLKQTIQNSTSTSKVGYDIFVLNDFLFITEAADGNNILRIYVKGSNGSYQFHQNLSISGYSIPATFGYYTILNYSKIKRNGYDSNEIFFPLTNKLFGVLELNNSNQWYLSQTIQTDFIPSDEGVVTSELSNKYLYILTSKRIEPRSGFYNMYLYSIPIQPDNIKASLTGNISYKKQFLKTFSYNNHIRELKVFDDQFFIFGPGEYGDNNYLFYSNKKYGQNSSFPEWEDKNLNLECPNVNDESDYEIFGNLLYSGLGYDKKINIYNINDILSAKGYSDSYIYNSAFYKENTCFVPKLKTTDYANDVVFGEDCNITFDGVERNIYAGNSVVLKPGTKIKSGSKVLFKVEDQACNSILYSKNKSNVFIEQDGKGLRLINEENNQDGIYSPSLKVYPIPSNNGYLYIRSKHNNIQNIVIYNLLGKLDLSSNELNFKNAKEIDINLSRYPKGIYFVKILMINNNEVIKRILIE
ncbi:zinc-dependent metalloprotease [Aquimarina macrocephali]|uniref:zinc-dependent metalloprotease n=1 Tax=Aquimarina macrocephali TaxID=666563 RepID=UPI0004638226|nr:zinc-dependent metalloprotease [Aquimarina macrocephali]